MQTKYTVVKDGGKWWVMEYVGNEPIPEMYKERSVFNIDFTEYNLKYNNAYTNKLPTLPEHADYWAKLEGKVIEEGEFDKKVYAHFDNKDTFIGKPYAIPKQESQDDLWDVAIAEARQIADGYFPAERDWFESWLDEYHDFFKQHFTITRK